MKTIATAAVLMMLAAPTWAGEQTKNEANDPANTNEPIVLSEAEMDGVTAGEAQISKSMDLASPRLSQGATSGNSFTFVGYSFDVK